MPLRLKNDEPSKSFKQVASLAKWSSGAQSATNILNFMAAQGAKKKHTAGNEDFLTRLAGAEARDAAEAAKLQKLEQPKSGPAGDETMREIEQAEAALRQREAKMLKYAQKRPLSGAELEAASELFWKHDNDANAVIDRDEWATLINEVARRTGRAPFSPDEASAAFDAADVDGNGEGSSRHEPLPPHALPIAPSTATL